MQTRIFVVLALVAALLALGTMTVAADAPIVVAKNTVPTGALYIDNQPHPIAANSDLWYRFDYSLSDTGKTRITTLRLLYGNKSGVDFEVYEPMDINAYSKADFSPVIGRGMPEMYACETGWCQGDNLVWIGALGATGTYHVRIVNHTEFNTTFQLTADGKGISLAQPIAITAATVPTAKIDDPMKSAVLDGKSQVIPANGSFWYRFDYTADPAAPVVKTIRLLYGNKSGLRFELYSPEQIANKWYDLKPVGAGGVQMKACDTGWCKGDDLVLTGAFGMSGAYYVRVINNAAVDLPAVLTLE